MKLSSIKLLKTVNGDENSRQKANCLTEKQQRLYVKVSIALTGFIDLVSKFAN